MSPAAHNISFWAAEACCPCNRKGSVHPGTAGLLKCSNISTVLTCFQGNWNCAVSREHENICWQERPRPVPETKQAFFQCFRQEWDIFQNLWKYLSSIYRLLLSMLKSQVFKPVVSYKTLLFWFNKRSYFILIWPFYTFILISTVPVLFWNSRIANINSFNLFNESSCYLKVNSVFFQLSVTFFCRLQNTEFSSTR